MRTTTLALFATVALAAGAAAAPAAAGDADVLQRAQILVARQSWADAVGAYKDAIAASPQDAALHNRLGICYQRMGDMKAARSAYNTAIRAERGLRRGPQQPRHARAHAGQVQAGDRAYDKAIEIKPKDAVFHKNLGAAWLARGNVEKALAAWNEADPARPARASRATAVKVGASRLRASRASTTCSRSWSPRAARWRRRSSTWARRRRRLQGLRQDSSTTATSPASSAIRATRRSSRRRRAFPGGRHGRTATRPPALVRVLASAAAFGPPQPGSSRSTCLGDRGRGGEAGRVDADEVDEARQAARRLVGDHEIARTPRRGPAASAGCPAMSGDRSCSCDRPAADGGPPPRRRRGALRRRRSRACASARYSTSGPKRRRPSRPSTAWTPRLTCVGTGYTRRESSRAFAPRDREVAALAPVLAVAGRVDVDPGEGGDACRPRAPPRSRRARWSASRVPSGVRTVRR